MDPKHQKGQIPGLGGPVHRPTVDGECPRGVGSREDLIRRKREVDSGGRKEIVSFQVGGTGDGYKIGKRRETEPTKGT